MPDVSVHIPQSLPARSRFGEGRRHPYSAQKLSFSSDVFNLQFAI